MYLSPEQVSFFKTIVTPLTESLTPEVFKSIQERQYDITVYLTSAGDEEEKERNKKHQQAIVLLFLQLLLPEPALLMGAFIDVYFDARGMVSHETNTPLFSDVVIDSLGCIFYLMHSGVDLLRSEPNLFLTLLDSIPEDMLDWRGGLTTDFVAQPQDVDEAPLNNNEGN
jgi:hypothetical protein